MECYINYSEGVTNMPKPTIVFYNKNNFYMGWKYLSRVTFFELKNWLLSGNYFFYKEQLFKDKLTKDNDLFILLRKQK